MNNDTPGQNHNNLAIKEAKTLIFDIGGIILDDSDQTLWQVLDISDDTERETLKNIIYLEDPRWMTEVMTGNLRTEDYMNDRIKQHPEYSGEIHLALATENFDNCLPLYRPNVELLKHLHKTGKYKMYWLSNMTDVEYENLEEKGIFNLLDGGAYSCIEHLKKPDPKFYQTLLERYRLNPEECVFFDDRKRNLDAGEKLGIRGELVPSITDLATVLKPFF